MNNKKLFDYLSQEANWIPLETDLQEIRDIVLEEAGFRWIPVSERLPKLVRQTKYSERVMVTTSEGEVVKAYYGYDNYWRSIVNEGFLK